MNPFEKKILEQISEKLRELFESRIAGIYAFGSKVRGNHHEFSDFDLLIVITEKDIELEKGIIDVIVDIELEAGLNFAPVIKSKESFDKEKQYNTPFYQNIRSEAISL